MTSANTIEYRIEKDGKPIYSHHENVMCNSRFQELLKFHPLSEHTIIATGYDEEEEEWEGEKRNLLEFLQAQKLEVKDETGTRYTLIIK